MAWPGAGWQRRAADFAQDVLAVRQVGTR